MSDRFIPLNSGDDEFSPRNEFVGLGGGNAAHAHGQNTPEKNEPPPDADTPAPKVVLHRDGSTIVSIEVECPCGQHVVLTCDYGDGSFN